MVEFNNQIIVGGYQRERVRDSNQGLIFKNEDQDLDKYEKMIQNMNRMSAAKHN